jgi:hypothetical protein
MSLQQQVKNISPQFAIYHPEKKQFYVPDNITPCSGYFTYYDSIETFPILKNWTDDISKCTRFDSEAQALRHAKTLYIDKVTKIVPITGVTVWTYTI